MTRRISRKDAKAAGLKYYFTGKPCKRGGHIDVRFVSSFCCKTCSCEKAKEAFRKLEGDKRELVRERNRQLWQRPEYRARKLRYDERYRVKARERNREYKKANRVSCTDRQNKRNAMLYTAFVEDVSLAEIFARDGGRCQLCGYELNMATKWPDPRTPTRDHVVPLSKGGIHAGSNLQLACAVCNIRKQGRVA